MSQIFKPSINTIARISLLSGILIAGLGLTMIVLRNWAPLVYVGGNAGIAVEQPIRFSHSLHSGQLNIECVYCHISAEQGAYGGIPDTHTCMSCHSGIATYSELLEPVRTSYATGEPVEWLKVHDLADWVYFNHSVHVQNGFACETCHGRVDQMPQVWQAENMLMSWCLECHREPERFIRPISERYTFGYEEPDNQIELGLQLIEEYHVDNEGLTNCSICHR
ncbi:MAG: cytochrome c3 family protein [Chloroflexi bacterium]|nr:cytochrome c3 family protein [Chloroflexota bacterium]